MTLTPEEVPVKPVSRFLVEACLEANPIPGYPEFDGEPLTLLRLEDKEAWENNGRRKKARRVWDRFVAQANEAQQIRNDALFRLLMLRGVDLTPPGPESEWAQGLADDGIDYQDLTPGTRKLLWIHEILPEPMDKLALLARVMEAGGLQHSTLDNVRSLFREALAAVDQAIPRTAGDKAA